MYYTLFFGVYFMDYNMFDEREAKLRILRVFDRHKVDPRTYPLADMDPYVLTSLGIPNKDQKVILENIEVIRSRKLQNKF